MFEMRFIGMMTQARIVDYKGVDRRIVVLYKVPEMPHHAKISFDKTEWDENASSVPVKKTGNARCADVKGVVTTDLSLGMASTNLFGVPNVTAMSGGKTIASEIINLTPGAHVAAIILLPDGKLYVEDWFELEGSLNGATSTCVPRTIVFQAKPAGNVTLMINGKTLVFTQDAKPYVTNLPPNEVIAEAKHRQHHGSSAVVMTHYKNHKYFFDDPTTDPTMAEVSSLCANGKAENDQRPRCIEDQDFSVECSNSRFP
jgi:hypothetical protein